jgi:translocation and assembly module TamB
VQLDGAYPPSPYVRANAVRELDEVTAIVRLEGLPSNLQLSFESRPPLPRDEVLSRLLFGEGAEELSPVQALQLARVAAQFAGGTRLGALTQPLERLGLDQVELENLANGPVLGVGKQVTGDLYVEVRQGADPASGKARAEYDITPRLKAEGEIEAGGEGGVGIFWKKDY